MKKEPNNQQKEHDRKQEYLERCKKAAETIKDLYKLKDKDPLNEWK